MVSYIDVHFNAHDRYTHHTLYISHVYCLSMRDKKFWWRLGE